MRKLTFPSFLARYLKELSVNETSAPLKLAKELEQNSRLLEPLCLYAAYTMNDEQLEISFAHAIYHYAYSANKGNKVLSKGFAANVFPHPASSALSCL